MATNNETNMTNSANLQQQEAQWLCTGSADTAPTTSTTWHLTMHLKQQQPQQPESSQQRSSARSSSNASHSSIAPIMTQIQFVIPPKDDSSTS